MGGGASKTGSAKTEKVKDLDPRYTSKATTLLQAALDNSFYGPLVPEADWVTFCGLWKQERAEKPLILTNRICFVVTFGIVSATTAPSGGEAVTARTFRSGEMIHLFSNHDKFVKHTDGELTAMDFDGIKVVYTLNKEAIVYGLDATEYNTWIKERPQLTSLNRFNQLKLSNIVHDNIYFLDITPSRIDMIGPLLRLRRAKVNDVLFKRGINASSERDGTGMGLMLNGMCVALYDGVELHTVRGRIASHYSIPLVALDQPKALVNPGVKEKKSRYAIEDDVGLAAAAAGGGDEGHRSGSLVRQMTQRMSTQNMSDGGATDKRKSSVSAANSGGDINVEEWGDALKRGGIFGFEQVALSASHGLTDIVVAKEGVYAEINQSVIRCLQIVDAAMEKMMRRNFAYSLIESLRMTIHLLSELDREACLRLAAKATFEFCKQDSVIFKPGDTGSSMFIVLQGCCIESYPSSGASGKNDATYLPSDHFGETAMLTSTPYSSTATAKEAAILMAFDQKAFNETFSATGDRAKMAEYQMRVKNSEHELSSVLYYPPALALFEAFSIKEIATESLFFWKAVEHFEDLCAKLEQKKIKAVVVAASSSSAPLKKGQSRSSLDKKPGQSGGGSASAAAGNPRTIRYVKQTESGPAQAKRQLAVGISQLRDMCTTIMTEYVFQGSPQQVNFPGKMRVILEKEVADWLAESEITSKYKEGDITANLNDLTEENLVIPTSLWAKAKHEAYMVMRKDTYARWSCSDEFTQFVNSLEPLPARKGSDLPFGVTAHAAGPSFKGNKPESRRTSMIGVQNIKKTGSFMVHA